MTQALLEAINAALPTIEGWCSFEKASLMAEKIVEHKAKLCVEIGVFGGKSLIPQAMALRHLGEGGIAYGIDPWSAEAALEEMQNDENRKWWGKTVDLDAIYRGCCQAITRFGLDANCRLLRSKSEEVAQAFVDNSVDVLHIDGNHCTKLAMQDATLYFPKVKPGGLIFFDDIWWTETGDEPSTRPAIMYLLERCTRLDLVGDCMLLQKTG